MKCDSITFLYYGRPGQTKGIYVYEEAIKLLKEKATQPEIEKAKFCFILSKDPAKGLNKFNDFKEQNDLDMAIAQFDYLQNDGVIFTTVDSLMSCFVDENGEPKQVTDNTKKAFANYLIAIEPLYVNIPGLA